MAERRVPRIRFKGFEEDWEQRKLGEIFEESNERSSEMDILSVSVSNGIYPASESDRDVNPGASLENYKIVHKGDIVYNSMRMWQGAVGESVYDGIVSPAYVVVRAKQEVDSRYFGYLLKRPEMLYKYLCYSQGNSKDTQTLRYERFAEIEARISIEVIEQQMISRCIGKIDSLLSLHQRKLEKLKILKKAMLEKMFPKNGAKVPEIRFSGFTDDWEQRKFSALVIRESIIAESREGLPSVEYEDVIAEEGVLNKDLRTKMMKKQGVVFFDTDVLYGKLRPYLHNWLMPAFDGVAVGDWWVLRPIEVDRSFLYRSIQTQKFDEIANQSSGSKMPRADWKLISETEFEIPVSLEEQKAVGNYFERVDSLISLHQRKLEKLRQIKKSMLERMFV